MSIRSFSNEGQKTLAHYVTDTCASHPRLVHGAPHRLGVEQKMATLTTTFSRRSDVYI